VRAHNDAERDRIVAILEEFNPIDFDHAGAVPLAEAGVTGAAAPTIETAAGPSRSTAPAAEETEVIPVVKEELDVGKRATERRYRVRTYVVEKPIEEAVTLRDERVVIEHRPVTGDRVIGEADFPKEREYEVVERHEEPVVTKHRTAEDVVVRKEAEEHTETVRDTLRETRVDVDKEEAKPAAPGPNRNR
jgi:stress response protein YsnF